MANKFNTTYCSTGFGCDKTSRLRPLARILQWGLLATVLGLASCQPSNKLNHPGLEPSFQDKKNTESKEESTDSGDPADVASQVKVQPLQPGLRKAGRSLKSNYRRFLHREPLGFDAGVVDTLASDLTDLVDFLRRKTLESPLEILGYLSTGLFILFLFLVAYTTISAPIWRWALRSQAKFGLDFTKLGTDIGRGTILLFGRIAPLLVLVLMSYFPLQALFNRAVWTRVVTRGLWLFAGYRLVYDGVRLYLQKRYGPGAEKYRTVVRFIGQILTLTAICLLALFAIRITGYRSSVRRAVAFASKLILSTVPLYFLVKRDLVMSLLPKESHTRAFEYVRATIDNYYYWLLSGTALLILMWAVGYQKASTFILIRGYAIILTLLVATYFLAAYTRFTENQLDSLEETDLVTDQGQEGQRKLLTSTEKLVRLGTVLVTGALVLEQIGLYEPVTIVLRTPLLVAGPMTLSIFDIVKVGVILFTTVLAVNIVKAALNTKVYPLYSVDVGTGYAINTLINYAIFVLGFFIALRALGVRLSTLTVLLASLGVGIGFGLQTLTENLISGFIILFGRSVQKGDIITVNDTYGTVQAVGARSVVVRTPDNVEMLIPSKDIIGRQIINWTYHNSKIRLHIPVGVSYEANPKEVEQILLSVASSNQYVIDSPEPEVWLVGFGDSAVEFELLVYFDCQDVPPSRLKGQIYYEIWNALHEADITIPFPQRDINFKNQLSMGRLEVAGPDTRPETNGPAAGPDQLPT